MTEKKTEQMDSTGREASDLNGLVMMPLPLGLPRMETTPIQFGDDWPGIFMRGDDALMNAMYLRQFADRLEEADPNGWLDATFVRGFAQKLESCKAS